MTLVGESGGLSSIYDVEPSSAMPGLIVVTTEHGPLYVDPDETYPVLALDQPDPAQPGIEVERA